MSGLMFLPVSIGGGIALVIVSSIISYSYAVSSRSQYACIFEPAYLRKMDKVGEENIAPEERLRMAMWAGPIFAISFFWMG